jgi:negative regulator of replication initiation
MTESIKSKREQIKNIMSVLETLKRENEDLYTELQEKWHGKNEVIFGKEKDEKGNLKELQEISLLT